MHVPMNHGDKLSNELFREQMYDTITWHTLVSDVEPWSLQRESRSFELEKSFCK